MRTNRHAIARQPNDRAVSVLIIAVAMVFVLAMAGLGVDLASLYVARSQAQRAADAAALAGAKTFVDQGCASGIGTDISGTCQDLARQRAEAVGNSNLIAGVNPNIKDADITFPSTTTSDPQIQVVAGRGTYDGLDHGNPLSTFFIKVFGIDSASVSATATAEAYNPSSDTAPTGTTCVKPWLLPNCDYDNSTPLNISCPGTAASFIVGTGADAQIANSSAIGELISIKPGDPSQASAPSQFYPVFLPPGDLGSNCPSCASTQTSAGSQSGAQYRQNIECCSTQPIVCGQSTIQAITGNMVGPTQQGVRCLIHEGGGNSGGQDTFDPSTWQILSGGYYSPAGTAITTSDSIATIPIYDGSNICPGGSSGSCTTAATINILGFMQVFIKSVDSGTQGTVNAYIMAINVCHGGPGGSGGGSGGSGGGAVMAPGGTAIPVRLIRQ